MHNSGAETKRLLIDEYDAQAEDIKMNGETAISRDARANTADEYCMRQR